MSTDPVDLYGDDDIYLYDDPIFNEDFDDRFSFVYETNRIYEKIYRLQDEYDMCINQINNYIGLKSKYETIIFNNGDNENKFKNQVETRISTIQNECQKYQDIIENYNIILDKIGIVKNLNSNNKQILYDFYKILGYGKIRFASLIIDKYQNLINYSEPIIYDGYIPDEEKRQVLEIIFVLEEETQSKETNSIIRILI